MHPEADLNDGGDITKSMEKLGLKGVERAPKNVFLHSQDSLRQHEKKKWTNYYELPVEYTVEIQNNLLSIENDTLAKQYMPSNLNRRFCIIDEEVYNLYKDKIISYFKYYNVELKIVLCKAEEENKIFQAVEKVLNSLCEFNLLRREPILAIGGGCILDIVGFTASCYRRGVPYIRIPTTLLGIVDASVGVKCGVDWYHPTLGGLKNRVGSFYPPIASFLDKSFISTQNKKNLINGMGEIMKLALIRSYELFELLEKYGKILIDSRFQHQKDDDHINKIADKVIELSIQIMLEELGPNLWEFKLERCVDYGHTFSKILEMNSKLMHGEAVNIDGFICVILSYQKNWISLQTKNRILNVMMHMGLPIWDSESCNLNNLKKAIGDGIEHRHGKLRMPLVRGDIGSYDFVNECSEQELQNAIDEITSILPVNETSKDQ